MKVERQCFAPPCGLVFPERRMRRYPGIVVAYQCPFCNRTGPLSAFRRVPA